MPHSLGVSCQFPIQSMLCHFFFFCYFSWKHFGDFEQQGWIYSRRISPLTTGCVLCLRVLWCHWPMTFALSLMFVLITLSENKSESSVMIHQQSVLCLHWKKGFPTQLDSEHNSHSAIAAYHRQVALVHIHRLNHYSWKEGSETAEFSYQQIFLQYCWPL